MEIDTHSSCSIPREAAVVGVPVWILLVYYVASTIVRPRDVEGQPVMSATDTGKGKGSTAPQSRQRSKASRR